MANTYIPDYSRQTPVYSGRNYVLLMPYSEVCDHMRIAGTVQGVLVTDNGVYLDDGKGPHLTDGEAGIYTRTLTPSHLGSQRFAYGMKLASAVEDSYFDEPYKSPYE